MNRLNMGVTFGDKHSYNDFGLILASKSIGFPEVKSRYVEVPSRDGDIDESEILTGRIAYGNREISLTFLVLNKKYRDWQAVMSNIASHIHGKKMRLVFDDDKAFYYIGRCEVDAISSNKNAGKFTVKINAETYKYAISDSSEPWLWDPFDFEYGVINDTYNRTIDGSETIVFDTFDKPDVLVIESTGIMTMMYNGTEYTLTEGTNTLYSVVLNKGTHTLEFTGNGIVTIHWTGGRL